MAVTNPGRPHHRRASPRAATFGTMSTPDEVLYANELMRGRMWVAVCVVLGAAGIVCAVMIEAPGAVARQLLGAGSAAIFLVSIGGLWILRRDGRYDARRAAAYSYSCLVAVLPAFHFFGWFSAVALLVALGGVIFAMGHSTRAVLILATTTIGAHATIGALTIAGTIPDQGIAMLRADGVGGQIVCLVACEAMFALSFVIGRMLRAQALEGIESYGLVIQENTRREALLQEAHDELRRAREVGVPGRYTGLELGSFQLGVVLGRGAMGEVYEATRAATGELAAVKVMTATAVFDERATRRFRREIDLAASLDSPHIVRILEHSAERDAVLYLAMERLEGTVLADELRTVRRPPQAEMLTMITQVAKGVATAHAAGIVHRDLSPRNIFHDRRTGAPVWKILDFGVSKLAGSEHSLTGHGVVGTPRYMSPEQAAGEDADHRSDLFALGCVAYRCLTGHPPFRGQSIADIVHRVVYDMPLCPSSAAALPVEVDLILAIALAKNRDHRFESAAELAAALAAACRGHIDDELERRGAALAALHPWATRAAG